MADPGFSAERRVCGIIMPISHTDDHHTVGHWRNVLKVVEVAVGSANLIAQPVWQNGDHDVIQAKILKNLFENDIVVCDVSTRNPNVMLELGMRLTTKKPTIIIAETGTLLPFDTSVISTEFYDKNLGYVETDEFIRQLAKVLLDTCSALDGGSYHAYLEHFRFETVEPSTVSISAEKAFDIRLDEILSRTYQLENLLLSPPVQPTALPPMDLARAAVGVATDKFNVTRNSNIKVGVKVRHSKFGEGIVAEYDNNKVEIDFEGVGRKRVLDSFLEIIQI